MLSDDIEYICHQCKKINSCNKIFYFALQFQVAAYDSQDPTRRTTSQVTVEVTRNPSGPNFLSAQYETTIAETYPLGEGVINATAVDQDGVCIT